MTTLRSALGLPRAFRNAAIANRGRSWRWSLSCGTTPSRPMPTSTRTSPTFVAAEPMKHFGAPFIVLRTRRPDQEVSMDKTPVPLTVSRRDCILTATPAAGGLLVGIGATPGRADAAAVSEQPWNDNDHAPHE